jgi:hypothetical protein
MVDEFQFWRDAIAGKTVVITADAPQSGYYKMRNGRDGIWHPVAIWTVNGAQVCRVGKETRAPLDVWTYCAGNPVTKEAAKHAFATGGWPDMPTNILASNMPSDPLEALKMEIADKQSQAEALLISGTAEKNSNDANKARNIQAQLLALEKRADEMFEAEKAPIRALGSAVDEKYRFRSAVKSIADRLRRAYESFAKAEEARLRAEAQKKFEAERAAAEAARKVAEEAQAKLLREDPIAALTSTPEPLPELPLAPEPVKVQIGGGFGRKAGLKTEWVAQIDDYAAATTHFADHPDVKALIEKLATKAVKAAKGAIVIPGVKVIEDRRAA